MERYARELDSLQFLVCGRLTADNGFVHARRVLDCHVLILMLEGRLHITQNGRDITAGAGDVLLLAEGCEHYGTKRSEGRVSYLWVHFCTDDEWETVRPENCVCHLPELFAAESPRRLRRLYELVTEYSRREDSMAKEMTLCALRLLLMETSHQADSERPGQSPLVAEISAWVRQNCHRRLRVSDIAERFHYSPDYISARFRRETGEPLSVFLNSCRIELAKSLLSGGTLSIKETAYSCGFTDEKYFARAFRKATGITPSAYSDL